MRVLICLLLLTLFPSFARAAEPWSTKLDSSVRFYQSTDVGVLVVGTEKSLYGLEAETGDVLWRRKDARLDETDVAAVPGTDVLLVTLESGSKTRLEALDIVTGGALWRSDKVRGAVMQTAFEPSAGLLAAVFVRDAKSKPREGFRRKPELHVFDLASDRKGAGRGDAGGLRAVGGPARGGLRARREVEAARRVQAQAGAARLRPRF